MSEDSTALKYKDRAGVLWVCDTTFNAKFSALRVSMIPSYLFSFTCLGHAYKVFYKLKYWLPVRSKQIVASFAHLQETKPGFEWTDSELMEKHFTYQYKAVQFKSERGFYFFSPSPLFRRQRKSETDS